ncbi:glycoside hydrolase family 16 protein [Pseudonocardia sp. MH-G8]|uniref:glycoside hydrolase family 16 protein n=1 Tax=Pseudonocardia sp. MH-G8 TaxID=1854588 RepID=UPI000BA06425|nr:family 16 glycosylhydrolase [Pseudonocardia sp. MH-G8]OZM84016.1 hypothetical protein CFP66_06250 [Pseudonocardia sp. MH-G8]
MSFEEIEELIRKYLAAGIAVVVVVVAPGTAAPGGAPPEPSVSVVEPERAGTGSGTGPDTDREPADPVPDDPQAPPGERTGADGRDPGSADAGSEEGDEDRAEPGDTGRGSGDDARSGAQEPAAAAEDSGSEGTTAAAVHGWGTPNREDDFTGGTEQWDIYDGPGHAGEGTRSPSAVTVQDGILTITGDSAGTTAGMAWNPGQKYGRWEGRVRAPASDPSYNALLLLWPDAEDFPVGGEIDFMEMLDHTRQATDIFIHYGEDNSQVNGQVEVDGTEWHNWAVEWTPEAITAYVDGEEWYRSTDTSIFPPGPMHLCIQLDWFPEGDTPQESTMHVDWVRQYAVEGS